MYPIYSISFSNNVHVSYFENLLTQYIPLDEPLLLKIDYLRERVHLEEKVGQYRAIFELLITERVKTSILSDFLHSLDSNSREEFLLYKDIDGMTALHFALSNHADQETIQMLIEAGASPLIIDAEDQTALDKAIMHNVSIDIYALLFSRLSLQESTDLVRRNNALDQAVIQGVPKEVLEFLVRQGGKISYVRTFYKLIQNNGPLELHQLLFHTLDPVVQKQLLEDMSDSSLFLSLLHKKVPTEILDFYIRSGISFAKAPMQCRIFALSYSFHYNQYLPLFRVILEGLNYEERDILLNKTDLGGNKKSLYYALLKDFHPEIILELIRAGARIPEDGYERELLDIVIVSDLSDSYLPYLLPLLGRDSNRTLLNYGLEILFLKRSSWQWVEAFCRQGAQFTEDSAKYFLSRLIDLDPEDRKNYVNTQDGDNFTLYDYYIIHRLSSAHISFLIGAGAASCRTLPLSTFHWAAMMKSPLSRYQQLMHTMSPEVLKQEMNMRDEQGQTVLHMAALYGAPPEVITFLISCGAENFPDAKGEYPILLVDLTSLDAIQTMTAFMEGLDQKQKGEMINFLDAEGDTLLMRALKERVHLEVIRFLFTVGSKGNVVDKEGVPSLFAAIAHPKYMEVVSLLLSDLDIEQRIAFLSLQCKGATIFHFIALMKLPVEVYRILLRGLNKEQSSQVLRIMQIVDNKTISTMQQLSWSDVTIEVVALLLEAGAPIDQMSQMHFVEETVFDFSHKKICMPAGSMIEPTTLHIAIANQASPEIIALLLSYIPLNERAHFLNLTFIEGVTALHFAAIRGDPKILRMLVEAGACVDLKSSIGNSLYIVNCQQHDNYKECMTALLEPLSIPERERVINIAEEGKTLLHHAVTIYEDPSIITFLLQSGANPNAVDNEGKTPLALAAERKSEEKMALLLQAGADPSFVDRLGEKDLTYQSALREGKEIRAQWLNCSSQINERGRVMESRYHNLRGEGNALELEAEDIYPMYVTDINFQFLPFLKLTTVYKNNYLTVVNNVKALVKAILSVEGDISYLGIHGHGPGMDHTMPSQITLGKKNGKRMHFSTRKMEKVVAALKLKMKSGGIIVMSFCGGGRKEKGQSLNLCEELARKIDKVCVIAPSKNSSGLKTIVDPNQFLAYRFFDVERGWEFETTVAFQADTRIRYRHYLEKTLIENYF